MRKIITPTYWRSFMKIEEIKHFDKNGNCIWEAYDIPNTMHLEGEEFILQLAFDTDSDAEVPDDYYIGLDNRSTISVSDTLSDLDDEPGINVNGYNRQPVSSMTGFGITTDSNNNVKASSSIVTFDAIGGTWGPVSTAFLATSNDNSGLLISTATLSNPRSVLAGETFSLRISVSLAQCP